MNESKHTNDCDGCKYWSECCAQLIGCGLMEALCLCADSPRYQHMVNAGCGQYQQGRSIDDPSL